MDNKRTLWPEIEKEKEKEKKSKPRMSYCPKCLFVAVETGAGEPLDHAHGYDPKLKQFSCKICKTVFYVKLRG